MIKKFSVRLYGYPSVCTVSGVEKYSGAAGKMVWVAKWTYSIDMLGLEYMGSDIVTGMILADIWHSLNNMREFLNPIAAYGRGKSGRELAKKRILLGVEGATIVD